MSESSNISSVIDDKFLLRHFIYNYFINVAYSHQWSENELNQYTDELIDEITDNFNITFRY